MLKSTVVTPWCEKYRPKQFDQIVLEEKNRIIFEQILSKNRFPHLLFYGPPGVGKTTSAENLINAYQERNYKRNKETIIHLNASDERGIEVIRNQIHQFVKCNNMFEKGYKFVILDEVDYMTKNAQQALKNLLQNCSDNVRFCLICNYICKIDESLKNEFICIRFNQLPVADTVHFIRNIAEQEKLTITDDMIRIIQKMYQSDIRSMINFLQLHQHENNWDDYIFHDVLWEELHILFSVHLEDTTPIQKWINNITTHSGIMDIKTCIQHYFNYLITNKKEIVSIDLLNIAENVLHFIDIHEYMIPYFITQMNLLYKDFSLKN
jgi:replication factor C subunit 3/5